MCWIAPEPSISATVNVSPGLTRTLGEIFQPWPRPFAWLAPVPSVAVPPRPFSPVKFSALMERVWASESRQTLPRSRPSPLKLSMGCSSLPVPDLVPGFEPVGATADDLERAADLDAVAVLELRGRVDS